MHKYFNMILKVMIITVLFVALFSVGLSPVMAEKVKDTQADEILVIGTGRIIDGNKADAKARAISEALLKGVERFLARHLGSKGMINNFPRIINDILPGAKEEVENFNILAEAQIGRDYMILMRLKVNEKMMEKKLRKVGLTLVEGPSVKILFMVSQIGLTNGEALYWWKDPEKNYALTSTELSLHRIFSERGFHPFNRLMNLPEGEYPDEMRTLELSDESAFRWGSLFSADVVVYGKCEVEDGREVSILLKALSIENGRMICRDMQTEIINENADKEQIIRSLDNVIYRIAGRMSPVIINASEKLQSNFNQIEVVIKGLRNFRQLREFEGFLREEIKGVNSVRQVRVGGNFISIMVEFSGNVTEFQETVFNHESVPFQAEVNQDKEGRLIVGIVTIPADRPKVEDQ